MIALLLGADQHLGQSGADELLLGAALQRLEAGHQARLGRESAEQALREGVDGLDAQAAAGRVENASEQSARAPRRICGRRARPVPSGRSQATSSLARTQRASREWMRSAISAAPALVKVRQRIEADRPQAAAEAAVATPVQ